MSPLPTRNTRNNLLNDMAQTSASTFVTKLRSMIIRTMNQINQQLSVRPPLTVFLAMSAAFFYLLWVIMFLNGSADAMNAAVARKEISPVQPLQVRYTHIAPVDNLLATLVAFTFPVTRGNDKVSMFLMVDIVSTLQTAMLWAHLDNNRVGRNTRWLAYPAVLFLAVNAMGAAVILPIYFYFSLKNAPTHSESYIQLWNAKPLTLAFVIGSLLPGLAEITATVIPRSDLAHQYVIAFMQASPLVMSVIQYVGSGLYPIRNIDVRTRKSAYIPSVQQALLVAGTFSMIAHLITFGNIVFGGLSARSIYLPDSQRPAQASESTLLLEGSRIFLQYDFIGICLSTAFWCAYLITDLFHVSVARLAPVLAFAIVLAGPGAVGCAVLSWREQEILENAQRERKAKQSVKA